MSTMFVTLTPFGSFKIESQRDSGLKPRVARNELPWVGCKSIFNPNGVVACLCGRAATPLGLSVLAAFSQGSSFLATLGFGPQSLWDCSRAGLVADSSAFVLSENLRSALCLDPAGRPSAFEHRYSCERTPWVLVTGAEPLNCWPACVLSRIPCDGMEPTFKHRRPKIKMHREIAKSNPKESTRLNLAVQRRAWKAQLSDAENETADSPGRLCGSLCRLPAAGRERHQFSIPFRACQLLASSARKMRGTSIDIRCQRSYITFNKPVTPLIRTAHQGGCSFFWRSP